MNYIIFDLEATCWSGKSGGKKSEIIEIGALKLNSAGETLSEFGTFVFPVQHPQLSAFCTELTSITQADVDGAPHFPEALAAFQEWIGVGREAYYLCSWGFYDRNQLQQDCAFHQLETAWLQRHISLKHQHRSLRGLTRAMGMAGALRLEGFTLDGTHHRGLDDARNIAKIFKARLGKWTFEPSHLPENAAKP